MDHTASCTCDSCLLGAMRSSNVHARKTSWAAWYERDQEALGIYIKRRCQSCGCAAHAEDILQDTFLIGFRNVSSGAYVDQGRALRAYLYGIAANLIHDVIRLRHREVINEDLLDFQISTDLTLEEQVMVNQALYMVVIARAALPVYQGQIVDGLYRSEKSSEQLGIELEKSAANVRIIAHRAVQTIAKFIEQRYDLKLVPDAIRMGLQLVDSVLDESGADG